MVRLGEAENGMKRLMPMAMDDAAEMEDFDVLAELGAPSAPVLAEVIRSKIEKRSMGDPDPGKARSCLSETRRCGVD
jgi:hypothetical protein